MPPAFIAEATLTNPNTSPKTNHNAFMPLNFKSLATTLLASEFGSALWENKETPVEQEALPPAYVIDPTKPMIALTFDDGPSVYTNKILDILEQYNSRATFCVLGSFAEGNYYTVLRQHEIGCEVIGHSWNHRDLTKLSEQDIRAQLIETNNTIESITGVAPIAHRAPYGAVNNSVRKVSRELGLSIILWTVDTQDWKTRNADAVYTYIMNNAFDKSIILCHDLHSTTAAAMERVVPELIDSGYQLVTVSELLYFSGKIQEPGVVYRSGW